MAVLYRLCGAGRSLERYVPACLEKSLASTRTTKKSDPLIAAVTPPLPPLQAKIGLFSEPRSITSWVRPERIGPTGSGAFVWNTAAKRVSCSTFSSYTRSATPSPLCGRASGWLSILTTSAWRAASAGSVIGSPVSGITGTAGAVVVVACAVVTGDETATVDDVVEDAGALTAADGGGTEATVVEASFLSLLQAAATRASAASATKPVRPVRDITVRDITAP